MSLVIHLLFKPGFLVFNILLKVKNQYNYITFYNFQARVHKKKFFFDKTILDKKINNKQSVLLILMFFLYESIHIYIFKCNLKNKLSKTEYNIKV